MSAQIVILLMSLVPLTTALAQERIDQTKSIGRLLDGCRVVMSADSLTSVHQTNYKMGNCAGYLHASYTQYRVRNQLNHPEAEAVCLPDHFHLPDFARIVVEYAESHPDHLNETLFALIYRAYADKFPCEMGADEP